MARHLDKDPATYCKERDGFVRDLQHFHDTRGTPFRRPPAVGGHEVDLFLLYSLVTKEGGWMKINSKNGWDTLLEKFDLPAKCVNGGVALKQVYIRYLDRYEKVHFLGEEAERGSDDDEESRHKRWSARALHSVPLNYNYHQHNIADSTRSYNGLSTTLYKASDYDRLALSLISPLPNEQDFAVNVCTLLCNEGKHTLRLDKCPRLVDYLLAHTGVFNHVSLRQVFTEVYTKVRKHSLNHFWYDILETNDVLDLANENNFINEQKNTPSKPISPPYKWRTKNNNNLKLQQLEDQQIKEKTQTVNGIQNNVEDVKTESQKVSNSESDRIVISDDESDSELFASDKTITKGKGFKLKVEPVDKELFCTGRTLGTQDYVGQRVLQIAHILRNLSFTEDNIPVLATNRTFLRFLLLCVSSRWSSIHQLGLDMLGNIAGELTLKDQSERLTQCLLKFITNGLHSQDRSIIIACLEILNKLSQRESNEDFMLRSLERRAYTQVCSFLTLHDVMLLIYTLECLYSLSSLGERACNFIVDVHGIIDTLVSLVTVEGKSYGPKACIGMKLVETVPGIINQTSQQNQQQITQQPIQQQQQVQQTVAAISQVTTTPIRPATSVQPRNIVTIQQKTTTAQVVQTTPTKSTTSQSVSTTPLSAQHVLQQQHAHQQAIQENEQFALAWLRATYEPCGHGKIEQQELYKQYLNSCSKIGRRGVIAPLHFPRCVRSVFGGTVGPNPQKNSEPPSNLLFYEGIRPRIVPLLITLPSAALQQTVQHSKQTAAVQRRKTTPQPVTTSLVTTTVVDTSITDNNQVPVSPASPILKAQLSAPPKPRESPTKVDVKSQVLAHPHLSQALLGNNNITNSSNKESSTSSQSSSPAAGVSSVGASISTNNSSSGQGSSSLIKSLLATKVNECMLPTHATSMRTAVPTIAPAIDSVTQVAQRQQRLLAQQNQPQTVQNITNINKKVLPKQQSKVEPKSKVARINGIRLSEAEQSIASDNVTSTSQNSENHCQPPPANLNSGVGTTFRGRREPPQPPPPPLAPLSTINNRAKTPRMDNEDSDSIGNNSVASSTGISSSNVAVSSTEDGENSLTSFEGILLNGIPHSVDIDAQCNEDSNSKDSIRASTKNKPLMLADLLEKKVDKDPPILNGVLCKELRIGDKGLELVDNHINKVLHSETDTKVSVIVSSESSANNTERTDVISVNSDLKTGVKRSAEDDISDIETKKRNTNDSVIVSNNLNGVDSPKPESTDSNDDSNANVSVSATAANMYASLAADILEDEDEELLMQQGTSEVPQMPVVVEEAVNVQQQVQVMQSAPMQQLIVTPTGQGDQQLIMAPRQIIVSQGQIQSGTQQVLITSAGQILQQTTNASTIKSSVHQTVQTVPMLVQTSPGSTNNSAVQQRGQVVLSQSGGTPIQFVQHGTQMQQVQLVQASGGPGGTTGQLVIQAPGTGANAGQTQYVIAAQSQTALVQGQTQTVLVAQTPQQQGTAAKTIIILQPQPQPNAATHHQKVVVTPQGQQVVVTQVQRPILQSSSVTNNIPSALVTNNQIQVQTSTNTTPIKSTTQTTVITQNTATITSPNKAGQILIAPKDRQSRPQTPVASEMKSMTTASVVVSNSTSVGTKIVVATAANSNATTNIQQLPPPPVIKDINHPWVCEWRGCTSTKKFKSANEVYMHACELHCPMTANPNDELQCLWDRCDTMKRKRFSLMTHLHDRHCSPDIMKAVAVRRKQLSQQGKTEIPAPTPPPPHPGYAPDAALHAIKRHALEFVNPKELQDDNEGPVTKSIRLTASLILRNLVIYSNNSRRNLATQASQRTQNDQNLERSIRRLDQDVRRSGRISRRDIEDILEEIRHTRSATSSQSLLVIRCCGNLVPEELPETRTKLVQEIWNTLLKLNVPMDISHYNALLRVYLENEHPFSPTDFLTELESKGIEPNRVTYQRLIARYCQLGDIEGATRILEFMREKQLPVNENVFNALIMGHSNTDDMESAHGILSVMQQAGLEPSADTYTTLLCGFARKGDIDSILSTLEECETKEVYLLDKDYLDIIFALSTNNHNEHVPVLLSKLRKSVGYNQDAINLILRLINHGQEATAMEVLKTIPKNSRTDQQPVGYFLIRQLVKVKSPADKIISICRQLQENDPNNKTLLYAAEVSLQLADDKIAYPILKELHSDGQTIRQHFFWPLIVSKGKNKDAAGVLDILNKMSEFNLTPSSETIREYVLPYISGNADEVINMLRSTGVSIGSAASSMIHKYLTQNNIKEAAKIASRVPAYYSPLLIRRPLTMSYLKSRDTESYITIVRTVYDNYDRRESITQQTETDDLNKFDKTDIIGSFVLDILNAKPKNNLPIIEEILNGLVNQGLSMSSTMAEKIQEKLGEKLTPEISSLLGKMTSGELTPIPLEKTEPHYTPSSAMNIPQLERLIANLEAKGEQTSGLKRQLLTLYTRAKELEKTEELLKKLKPEEFTYTSGVYAQLIDLYAHHEKLAETLEYYNKLKELEPNMSLDDSKVIKVVSLLIKNDRFDEGLNLLNSQTRDRKLQDKSFTYSAMCWRLLNFLAEQGKTDQLNQLFESLVKNDYIEVNNVLLGPLIKVQLINNDVIKAMEKFEWCCTQYRATPWKNELACKLIQAEDAEKLQKLTDLSTNIHGEVNSLYDLVFAFVECGRIRQARKILETPGLQTRPQRINSACERYREEGLVKPLEGLVEATKDLSHIDRTDIYYQLLLSYIKQDDSEKALGLWTQMQEEDVQPSEEFLTKLGGLLKSKKMTVPFTIPKQVIATKIQPKQLNVESQSKNELIQFRQLIKSGQIDSATQLKSKVTNYLNATDYSLLLEGLVKDDRHNEASKLCFEMLQRNMHPIPRVFRFFLNKVANNGDIDTMERIGSKLSSDMKKVLSFDNRLCHANIVAGKADAYLDILIKEIEHAKDDQQVQILAEKFPRGGAVGILEKCPELTAKYESLAEKYAKRGVIAPMNVLWAQHFINNDSEAANRIWSTHLAQTPRIMFQRVVQLARETKNESLIRRLIDHLKSSKVSEGALGNAYSCLLDVLVALEKHEDSVTTFEQAIKDINIEHINRTALLRIKEVCEKSGKPFNHQIPSKNTKSSTSSSSSSEDDKKR